MANGPEPKDRNTDNTPSFSAEDRLKAFRAKLDGPKKGITTLPGFLFRDGRNRNKDDDFGMDWNWADIDEDLLNHHAETYRRGLEARVLILDRIRPARILETAQVSGCHKGEVGLTEEGVTLVYPYPIVKEERGPGSNAPRRWDGPLGNSASGGPSLGRLTGKWFASSREFRIEVGVYFGNREFYDDGCYKGSLYSEKLNEFFADYYQHNNGGSGYFDGLPKTIWRRPDNLEVGVTISNLRLPRNLPMDGSAYFYSDDDRAMTWFDQSASQQEIMDYLSQKLEAQRIVGQLPSQLEALELAKIEELRRRGLFIEPR